MEKRSSYRDFISSKLSKHPFDFPINLSDNLLIRVWEDDGLRHELQYAGEGRNLSLPLSKVSYDDFRLTERRKEMYCSVLMEASKDCLEHHEKFRTEWINYFDNLLTVERISSIFRGTISTLDALSFGYFYRHSRTNLDMILMQYVGWSLLEVLSSDAKNKTSENLVALYGNIHSEACRGMSWTLDYLHEVVGVFHTMGVTDETWADLEIIKHTIVQASRDSDFKIPKRFLQ